MKNWMLVILGLCIIGLLVIPSWNDFCEYKNQEYLEQKNHEYESYCDSIFESNPDYYLDVLSETDEYQDYVKKHGEWWNE